METIDSISKDTRITAILTRFPGKAQTLARIMTEFGIHCVGCGAAGHETLEQGVLGHGYSKRDLEELIDQLNQALEADMPLPAAPGEFGLVLTDAAAKKVKDVMQEHGNPEAVLRIEVLEGGCSGYRYELQILDQAYETDWCAQQDGLNIAVDQGGLDQLNGIEIDYIDTLNESGFKFNNPNATRGCGCGKSFG